MTAVPQRLRVAVAAGDRARRDHLALLVARSGHQVVALTAAPDAVLSDGGETGPLPAPAVAIGSDQRDYPGQLPDGATAIQIDAALRAVAAGLVVRKAQSRTLHLEALSEEYPVLAPREAEVVAALGDGLSNKEAARRLGISPNTVKFHVEALFRK
ncbi:MAG: response regulator transcription factor, partial [Alphaproteobacteria bacterium]|nr:response regulator transcription factor [Alphaproteobacteria bacterium]